MKYGLIGERLGHSFSKKIHESLGYEYELREIARDELDGFMRERDFLGINVTIPYKEAVIPYLDWIEDGAKEIGAVNTIVNRDGRLYGYNTDFSGMLALICHAGVDVKGRKAAILGTGGTSKTAAAVLRKLGAREILKVSRSAGSGVICYDELYREHSDTEIIINTTPVGMYPNIHGVAVDLTRLDQPSGVIDAVYNPIRTTLIQQAKELGVAAESGLYMLVTQALVASELFLNENGNAAPHRISKLYERIKADSESIVLIGMPASGKSTVGKILADRLGRAFIDTDELIKDKIGMSISEYFAKHGEAKFREVEASVIREIGGTGSCVIATGGGAILREDNLRALRYTGRLYFIDRPLECLMPTDDRPLSSDIEAMKRRYAERYPIYCKVCDEHIDAECDAEGVADKILEKYK